jgi:hypothetical protein
MKTRAWVVRLLVFYLKQLSPQPDQWPQADTEDCDQFESIWDEAFQAENVSDKQAFEAVRRLCRETKRPIWRSEHLPAVLEMVKHMRAENVAQGDGGASGNGLTLQEAKQRSTNCRKCGGIGLITVFHRFHENGRTILVYVGQQQRTIPSVVSAYCTCDYGRAIKLNHERTVKDGRLCKDLADCENGHSEWLTEDPSPQPVFPPGFTCRPSDWPLLAGMIEDWMSGIDISQTY